MVFPSFSEPNMGKTDGSPGEQRSQTGQSLKPGEDNFSTRTQADVCDRAECEDENYGEQWTSRFVNVCEEFGSVALFGECRESTRSTVDSRIPDGDDRDQDDYVHEAVKAYQSGVLRGNDKR